MCQPFLLQQIKTAGFYSAGLMRDGCIIAETGRCIMRMVTEEGVFGWLYAYIIWIMHEMI
jgi:hypothetical protein